MKDPCRWSVAAVLCGALVGLSLLIGTAPVFAHAQYASSTPAKGARLSAAPSEVTITFTQEIQKIAGTYEITVNKDRGLAVTAGPAVVSDDDRTMMSVALEPELADGRYVVRWKNVSDADGDPAEGAFSFYLNYEPNTVDLANDAQLEQVGAEEAPDTGDTPTSDGDTPVTSESPAQTPDGVPTAAPTPAGAESEDEDDDSASTLWVILGAIAIGGVAGVGAFVFARSRRR